MNKPLRILYVDESNDDRALVRAALAIEEGAFEIAHASNVSDFHMLLERGGHDLVLSEAHITGVAGLQVIDLVNAKDKRLPVVIVTGTGSEEVAAEAMRRGASDYVVKTQQQIDRLPFTLRCAIHEARMRDDLWHSVAALRDAERRLRLALLVAHQGLFELDVALSLARLSNAPSALTDRSSTMTELDFETLKQRIHPADRTRVWTSYLAHCNRQSPELREEFRILGAANQWRWVQIVGMEVERDATGYPCRILGIHSDITAQKAQEEQLRLAASVFENSRELIVICDARQEIVTVNRAFCELTGKPASTMVGQPLRIIMSAQHDGEFYGLLNARLDEAGYWQGEIWHCGANDHCFPALTVISQVRNSLGEITHYIHIATDISSEKRAEEEIHRRAFFDPLTGLPNRSVFSDRAEQVLSAATRLGGEVALIFMDLDHFKAINDSLGHQAGDSLLQEVARRLQCSVREMDSVCRLGGDEFAVLLPHGGERAAAQVAEKLCEAMHAPISLEGQTVQISCSVGIAISPKDGGNYKDLLANADVALYKTKAAGRDGYRFYASDMNMQREDTRAAAQALRQALEKQQFLLYYQPQIDLGSGELVGIAACLRWQHPQLGLVCPDDTLRVARESLIVAEIGAWVLEEVCRQLGIWSRQGQLCAPVTVSISTRRLLHGQLSAVVDAALQAHRLDAKFLQLEIAESILTGYVDVTQTILGALQQRGIAITIADFAGGNICLADLRRLPLRKLKIHRSYIEDIASHAQAREMLAGIVAIGHALGCKILVYGVTSPAQRSILIELGCDQMQGDLACAPLAPECFNMGLPPKD